MFFTIVGTPLPDTLREGGEMKFRSLSRKLVMSVILASSVMTAIMTAISFYLDFRSEISELHANLEQIKQTTAPGLALAVWNVDNQSLDITTKNITTVSSITKVAILDQNGSLLSETDSKVDDESHTFIVEYDLIEKHAGYVGKMIIVGTHEHIYDGLIRKGAVFFVTQGIKTIIISVILLFLFNYYVTNHLTFMANNLSDFQGDHKFLNLRKRGQSEDEIDIVVRAYNRLIEIVKHRENQQDKAIGIHKAHSINSARLASLGEMATGIAHEINNPLGIIQGSAHIALKEIAKTSGEPKIASQVQRIIDTSSRIAEVIDVLKGYSRDASNDPFEVVSLQKVVGQALDLCRQKFSTTDRILTIDEFPDVFLNCRETDIVQVLICLLNNSYDATSHTSEKDISILFSQDDYHVWIRVVDSGVGISKNDEPRIFDPFFLHQG